MGSPHLAVEATHEPCLEVGAGHVDCNVGDAPRAV